MNANGVAPHSRTALFGTQEGVTHDATGAAVLSNPVRLGPVVDSSANGAATWSFVVPTSATGRLIYLQAAQVNGQTHVILLEVD